MHILNFYNISVPEDCFLLVSLEETVQTLIRCYILQYVIWVYIVWSMCGFIALIVKKRSKLNNSYALLIITQLECMLANIF